MDFLLFVLVCYYNSHYYFLFSSYQHLSFLFRVFNRILGGGAKEERGGKERPAAIPVPRQWTLTDKKQGCHLYSVFRLQTHVFSRSQQRGILLHNSTPRCKHSKSNMDTTPARDRYKTGRGKKKLEYICTAVQMIWYVRSQISSVQNQITHSSLERGGKNVSWAGFFSRIISVIFFLALYSLLKP